MAIKFIDSHVKEWDRARCSAQSNTEFKTGVGIDYDIRGQLHAVNDA